MPVFLQFSPISTSVDHTILDIWFQAILEDVKTPLLFWFLKTPIVADEEFLILKPMGDVKTLPSYLRNREGIVPPPVFFQTMYGHF